jgi:hypothetical protein
MTVIPIVSTGHGRIVSKENNPYIGHLALLVLLEMEGEEKSNKPL